MLPCPVDYLRRYLYAGGGGGGGVGETGASWSENCIFPNSDFNVNLLLYTQNDHLSKLLAHEVVGETRASWSKNYIFPNSDFYINLLLSV